jgi:ABC-type uncharacterized transport system involved in gliding motility auxiliary subunit
VEPAAEPAVEPEPAPAPEGTQDGEPAEGEFPNPQNPDAEPEAEPAQEAPETATPPSADPTPAPVDEPSAEPAPTTGDEEGTEADKPEEKEVDHHLAQGTKPGAVVIVSDVDMLFDFFLGDPNSRGGQRSHDNLSFVFNLIESLAGDQDLIEVRGRSSTNRPFKKIDEIRAAASEKQSSHRAEIQMKMDEANKALMFHYQVV